jgi:CDP-6-deoxy-D-xylo-4-hexulose-3-dehydrase
VPDWRYPLSSPLALHGDALEAAHAVLRSGQFTMGHAVAQFEHEFAAWVGSAHAVMVNSGSSANLLMVDACLRPTTGDGWQPGSEVLVPALAWSTTVWPIVQLGLVPIWVDIDPETLAIDWTDAARKVSSRTVAAMLVHVMGLAADLDAAEDFCTRHALTLLEDGCEAFGAHHAGRSVGTVGRCGSFSFYFSHQLPTIEGGMIVTDDPALADDLRSARSHGWTRPRTDHAVWERVSGLDPRFLFVGSGYNLRPLELQGAIGSVQLRHAEASLTRRELAVASLLLALKRAPWIRIVGAEYLSVGAKSRQARRHAWMNLPCVLDDDAPVSRDQITAQLEAAGIETRPLLAGNLLRHPAFQTAREWGCPVADRIMRQGFLMGCHPHEGLQTAAEALQLLAKVAA